jgi:hypothetical protein
MSLLKAKIQGAAGGEDEVAIMLTSEDARTYRGAAPNIDTITPAVGPVFSAGAPVFGNADPAIDTANGIFVGGNGLSSAIGALLPDLLNFTIDLVFIQPTIVATYATVAAMNAAVGSHAVNDVVYVSSDAAIFNNTEGYGQPLSDTVLGMIIDDPSYLNRSYHIKRPTPYNDFVKYNPNSMARLTVNATPGDNRCEVSGDTLGRLSGFVYNPVTGQASAAIRKIDAIAYRPGKPQHIRVSACNGMLSMFWNGIELSAEVSAATFAPDRAYFGAGAITIKALVVTKANSCLKQNAVTDALADHYGTPRVEWPDTVDLIVHRDQSRTAAAPGGTTGDLNRPDEINWNGETTARDGGDGIGAYDGKRINPTQTNTPGLYANSILNDPKAIRPFAISTRIYGAGGGPNQSGSGSETIEAGIWRQYKKWGGRNHLLILGCTLGGYSHANLQASAGTYLHSLTNAPINEILYPFDALNAMVRQANIWARQRGQKLRLICVSDLQAETDVGLAGISATREAAMRAWFSDKLVNLVDVCTPSPLFITKCASYSFDGFGNGSNTAAVFWRDDEQRRIGLNRDGKFRFRTLCSVYAHQGRFIHWTALAQRKLGEHMGDIIGQALFAGDNDPVQVNTAVRSGANIVLTLNAPVDIVATMIPTVHAVLTTGGFNTYGLVYTDVGGAKTINGNVTLSGDGLTITVPISGGGADAGDYIDVTGPLARWSNFRARERRYGLYPDQVWPATPFASASPTIDDTGAVNDITEWLAPSHHVLA